MERQEIERRAMENIIPQPPVKNELGGGIYYTCHWIKCGETLNRWFDFCPKCGQRIDWKGVEDG